MKDTQFHKDTIQLLDSLVSLLEEIKNTPNLLGVDGQVTTSNVDEYIDILREEIHKVKNLENRVAFTGTMKAGKSTAINAIAGIEILPARAEAMTVVPTLVEHDEHREMPLLQLTSFATFNNILATLRLRLARLITTSDIKQLFPQIGVQMSAHRLLESPNFEFEFEYSGSENIINALTFLNDVARLCGTKQIDIQVERIVDNICGRLPRIFVKLEHVELIDSDAGKFVLLDLPGPNEASLGNKLRDLVFQELERASSIVVVANFTQIGDEAEKEIREICTQYIPAMTEAAQAHASCSGDVVRAIVLLNKYDMAMSGDATPDQAKRMIKELMGQSVDLDRIFPVSARKAVFAKQIQRLLRQGGTLDHNSGLARDFAKLAFSVQAKKVLASGDKALFSEGAEGLWEESEYPPALEKLKESGNASATIALLSGLDKITDYSTRIWNFLSIRSKLNSNDLDMLLSQINSLKDDITFVGSVSSRLHNYIHSIVESNISSFKDTINSVRAATSRDIDKYLKTGDPRVFLFELQDASDTPENAARSIEADPDFDPEFEGILSSMGLERDRYGALVPMRKRKGVFVQLRDSIIGVSNDFDEYKWEGSFKKSSAAKRFLELVLGRIGLRIDKAYGNLKAAALALCLKITTDLNTVIEKELAAKLASATQRLREGFDIELSFPEFGLLDDMSEAASEFGDAITSHKKKRRCRVERRSMSGKVKRWWGSVASEFTGKSYDWGYDIVEEKKTYYKIDRELFQRKVFNQVDVRLGGVVSAISSYHDEILLPQLSLYFQRLSVLLTEIRDDIHQTLGNHQLKVTDRDKLGKAIAGFVGQLEKLRRQTELGRQQF